MSKATLSTVKLNKDNKEMIDGLNRYYHNDTSINDWLCSSKVDASLKILLRLTNMFLLPQNKNKKPEERIFAQNTYLSEYINDVNNEETYYSINKRNTVRALDRLFEMGAIKRFDFEDSEGNKHAWKNGTFEEWNNDFKGLTKRYIVLDINRIKELLTITDKSNTYVEAEKRSSLRRLVMRRPFTLVDHIDNLRNQQVADVRDAKKVVNMYLLEQYKRFGNFSEQEVVSEQTSSSEAVLSEIYRYMYPDDDYLAMNATK